MAYSKFRPGGWKNLPDETTPITAQALNHIEDGIASAAGVADSKAAADHKHSAEDVTSGVLAPARLGTGTADSGKVLFGDGVWRDAPTGGDGTVTWANVTGKPSTFPPSAHTHPYGDITGAPSIPTTPEDIGAQPAGSYVLTTDPRLSDPRTPTAHVHSASDIDAGVFDTARLGTGTANSTKVLFGDGVWRDAPTGGDLDLSDAPAIEQARSETDTDARWTTRLPGSPQDMFDVARHYADGKLVSWQNEWGALRGTSPFSWGDALVRGVRSPGDGIASGNFVEIVDRNLPDTPARTLWGIRWADGRTVRKGIVMADVVVLVEGAPVPPDLPPGTLIARLAGG